MNRPTVKAFGSLSPSQRRMVAAGKIGELVELRVKDRPDPYMAEVVGLATPAELYPDTLRSVLVVKHYYSEDLLTVPLHKIETLVARPWPLTDYRNPEYEEQTYVVRPAARRRK